MQYNTVQYCTKYELKTRYYNITILQFHLLYNTQYCTYMLFCTIQCTILYTVYYLILYTYNTYNLFCVI